MKKNVPLKTYLIQTNLIWDNPSKNLKHLENSIIKAPAGSLVVLPEMFTTGFSMNTKLAATWPGQWIEWMQKLSDAQGICLCGSLMLKWRGKNYNRFVALQPKQDPVFYDKRHLFSYAKEHKYFSKGKTQLVFEWQGWKIAPFICYDLRFPVWCRRHNKFDYHLALFVANWPEARIAAWDKLLMARAIENQVYVAGCNITGKDNKNNSYAGHSAIYNFGGDNIAIAKDNGLICGTLSQKQLTDYRKEFTFYADRDKINFKF